MPLLRRGRLLRKEDVLEEVREYWAKLTSRITVYCDGTYETARGLAVCFEEVGVAFTGPLSVTTCRPSHPWISLP